MRFHHFTVLIFILLFKTAEAQEKLLVAVQSTRDSVAVFDLRTKTLKGQVKTGFFPHEVVYDRIGNKCYVSDFGLHDYDFRIGRPGSSITVFDPVLCRYTGSIYTTKDTTRGNGPHGLKIRPGTRELFVNVEIGGDSMLIYDLDSHILKRGFPISKGTHNFIFSPDGSRLWIMAANEGVFEIDPQDGMVIHHLILPSAIRGLCVGRDWIVASGKNELFLLSKKDLQLIKHFGKLDAGQILYSAITKDQKYILSPVVFDSTVLVINARSGKIEHRLKTLKTPIHIQVTKKFAYVSHAEDNGITTIDLSDFTISNELHITGTNGIVLIK